MKSGASASDNNPWAMVVPPGNSFFARSWSTWIHCSSHVASANWLIRSCEISIQSLTPISEPTADLVSLKSLNIRMFVAWSDLHFGDGVGNDEFGFRYGHDLRDADTRCRFQQGRSTLGETDHSHISHDQTHRSCRRQRQRAFGDDLRFSLRSVLHGDDDPLGAADEIHRSAHSRHHLAGDHPVGEMAVRVDLQAAQDRHI